MCFSASRLEKIWKILPRSRNKKYLISLTLKRRLTERSVVNKQQICPGLVNAALQKSTKLNPFYSNFTTDNEWEISVSS